MNPAKYTDAATGSPHGTTGILVFMAPGDVARNDKYSSGVFDVDLDARSPFHRMRLETTVRLLTRHRDAGGRLRRVLDVGCGLGQTLEAIGTSFPGVELTGMDLSLSALERAARRVPAAELVLGDGRTFPFTDGYFDAVVLNNVIEHVPNPVGMLEDSARVLAPGGGLVVSTPSRYRFANLVRAASGRATGRMSSDHVVELSVGQVSDMLRWVGLEVVAVEGPRRKPARRTVKNTISGATILPVMRAWLGLMGSHHVLETTAFFLAKAPGSASP